MPFVYSFLKVFSLRTGTAVSLFIGLIFLLLNPLIFYINAEDKSKAFNNSVYFHLIFGFVSIPMACIGVYLENSTLLIPEMARRVLAFLEDVIGLISHYFHSQVNREAAVDVGENWFDVPETQNMTLTYLFKALYIIRIPLRIYLFVVMLSYYLLLQLIEHNESIENEGTTESTEGTTTSSSENSVVPS